MLGRVGMSLGVGSGFSPCCRLLLGHGRIPPHGSVERDLALELRNGMCLRLHGNGYVQILDLGVVGQSLHGPPADDLSILQLCTPDVENLPLSFLHGFDLRETVNGNRSCPCMGRNLQSANPMPACHPYPDVVMVSLQTSSTSPFSFSKSRRTLIFRSVMTLSPSTRLVSSSRETYRRRCF